MNADEFDVARWRRVGATPEELTELEGMWGELGPEEKLAEAARMAGVSDAMLADNLGALFPGRTTGGATVVSPGAAGGAGGADSTDQQAQGILADFRARADEVLKAAEAEAAKIMAAVDKEVPVAVAEAEAEVNRLKRIAEAEAERLLSEAEAAIAAHLAATA
jgi:hypothetical protein